MMEVEQGYPQHAWVAVGHLGEASDEMIVDYPELASAIREERLAYMAGINAAIAVDDDQIMTVDSSKLYRARIMDLLLDVTSQAAAESDGAAYTGSGD